MTAVIDTGGLADCLIGLYEGKTGKTDKFFGIMRRREVFVDKHNSCRSSSGMRPGLMIRPSENFEH
jgi:hypothetical protein